MPTIDDLRDAFRTSLDLEPGHVVDNLAYRSIEEWDSVAHMVLVAELEDRFDIMLETDDVIDMSSFDKAISILTKYGIEFE